MAKRTRRRRRRSRRGMGSIVRVRRVGGLGMLRGRTGMILAPAIGGAATAVAALSMTHLINPASSRTNAWLVANPWVGGAVAGFLASGLVYFFGGRTKASQDLAMSAATTAGVAALFGWGMQRAIATRGAELEAVSRAVENDTPVAPEGVPGIVYQQLRGAGGMGAIVPEYQAARSLGGLGNPYGETVSLQGVNTSVFGTPAFG